MTKFAFGLFACLFLAACAAAPFETIAATPTVRTPLVVTLVVDRRAQQVESTAQTVGELLREAGIEWDTDDRLNPPADTELYPDEGWNPGERVITLVRVSESVETIPESVPFRRQIVRSSEMSPDDPPRLVQEGIAGLQETTLRIVYHDGLEVERWPVSTTIVEPARDEIVMIGVGSGRDSVRFRGMLAYISDGRAIVLRGSTEAATQLPIEGRPDGRVFELSPDGRFLLYTVGPDAESDGATSSFRNTLWLIETAEQAIPRALRIENVLWAGWDPSAVESPRIAYTTARSVTQPPGWEANNDLWVMDITPDDTSQPAPVRLTVAYPAAYGWWGGNYAWSPDGRFLAYAYADEVGLLDMADAGSIAAGLSPPVEPSRTTLQEFTALNTGADWAWLPELAWATDSKVLAYTLHTGDDAAVESFELWQEPIDTRERTLLDDTSGMWSQAVWSRLNENDRSLAYLQPAEPDASSESLYSLWIVDESSPDSRQLFPPDGETGRFSRVTPSLAWEPGGTHLAFIFDDALHIYDTTGETIYRRSDDDSVNTLLSWAPYGSAAAAP